MLANGRLPDADRSLENVHRSAVDYPDFRLQGEVETHALGHYVAAERTLAGFEPAWGAHVTLPDRR